MHTSGTSALALRRRRLFVSLVLLAAVLVPAGGLRAADSVEVVRIGGTGCALGGIQEAARVFHKKHPGTDFTFAPSLGSSGGIKAVLAGALDLGLSARPLSDEERKQGADAVEYARTPFIFVTSHHGRVMDLTLEDVVSIYAGETRTWPDGSPLRLVLRPAGDADTAYLKGMSPAMNGAVESALARQGMVTAITDQENAGAMGRLRGGFGAATLAQITAEHRPLRVLRMNGVMPSIAALADGSYPYYKILYAVTGPRAGRGTRAFIQFLFSPEGRAILARTGHLSPRTR